MNLDKNTIIDQLRVSEKRLSRRSFLKSAAVMGLVSSCPLFALPASGPGFSQDSFERFIREAGYYEKLDHKQIRCTLCPRECVIDDRERGYCGVRENLEGIYYTLVYGRACTYHIDPVEKKPLYHFLPGSLSFSIAAAGCNMNCRFCQNWQISQVTPEQVRSIDLPPASVVKNASAHNCASIAYTYSEPTVFYEYMYDTAEEGRSNNIKSVVITAAYINQKPLQELCKKVDAVKIDLKSFSDKYYKEIVNGELKPVLDALVTIKKSGVWNEIVYLVVPTLNDSEQEIRDLCRWIQSNLGRNVPIHFTRFHPQYLLKNLPPTPLSTLERCKAIADSEGLNYVYLGNVPGHKAGNTYCPECGKTLIQRLGYQTGPVNIKNNECEFCKSVIPGIWK